MTTTTPKNPGLYAKLAEVMGLMRSIPKEGFNTNQKYKFVRETDVAEKASELLAQRSIWIHQTLVEEETTALYTTASGAQMWLTRVKMAFQFIDGETGEQTEKQVFPGAGADTGDKGVYKAMTGAEKYFLMKSFLVSTGDDPEADEKVDKAAAAAGATAGPVRITKGKQAGVERGGKSANATAAQVSEIARLAGALRLDAESVVPVIRKVIGTDPKEGQSIRQWLGDLTAKQAGDIIYALEQMAPDEDDDKATGDALATEAGEHDVEGEQEAVALV